MRLKIFLAGLGLTAALAGGASADALVDEIVSQLKAQGYSNIQVSRTLLGRSRITATAPERFREIIVNPRTGEILRDWWEKEDDAPAAAAPPAPLPGPEIIDPEDDGPTDDAPAVEVELPPAEDTGVDTGPVAGESSGSGEASGSGESQGEDGGGEQDSDGGGDDVQDGD